METITAQATCNILVLARQTLIGAINPILHKMQNAKEIHYFSSIKEALRSIGAAWNPKIIVIDEDLFEKEEDGTMHFDALWEKIDHKNQMEGIGKTYTLNTSQREHSNIPSDFRLWSNDCENFLSNFHLHGHVTV